MTTAEFIAAVEAKPNFIKWAEVPAARETIGDIEKHQGIAFISTPNGRNTFNVWFLVDKTTGEAEWQNGDTLEPGENVEAKKQAALERYLSSNFDAHFVNRVDLENNWAEADVYELAGTGANRTLRKSTIVVYKKGTDAINHLPVSTV